MSQMEPVQKTAWRIQTGYVGAYILMNTFTFLNILFCPTVYLHSNLDLPHDLQCSIHTHKVQTRSFTFNLPKAVTKVHRLGYVITPEGNSKFPTYLPAPRSSFRSVSNTYRVIFTKSQKVDITSFLFVQRSMGL